MDKRAVTPVVEKTISIGLVVLFVAGLTTTLLGGTVPDYRSATGEEMAERVLAAAAETVTDAVPASNGTVSATASTELPATIAGQDYRIRLRGRQLHLDHPTAGIDVSTSVSLPGAVDVRNSTWRGGDFQVRLAGGSGNRSLEVGSA